MSTIFSKIIAREIPGHFIYEDEVCAVIMDAFPALPGQSLVILKREVDYLFDTTNEEYAHLLSMARAVAKATDKALHTVRTCMVVEGFEVPHVHIKLYPFTEDTDSTLAKTIGSPAPGDPDELAELAAKIKTKLEA